MAESERVPDRELQIARRLRDVRKKLLISQTLFAMKAEVSQPRLAKYELGAVPLPWSVGGVLCRIFRINPIWLGTGNGDVWEGGMVLDERLIDALGARPLFSTVIDEIILPFSEGRDASPRVEKVIKNSADHFRKKDGSAGRTLPKPRPTGPFLNSRQMDLIWGFTTGPLSILVDEIHPTRVEDYISDLTRSAEKLVAKHRSPKH